MSGFLVSLFCDSGLLVGVVGTLAPRESGCVRKCDLCLSYFINQASPTGLSNTSLYTFLPCASRSETLGGSLRLPLSLRRKKSTSDVAVLSGKSSWMKWPASGKT